MYKKEYSCEQDLIYAIGHSWLSIKQFAKKILSELKYDLTFEQIMILSILEQEEGLNIGSIAERADRERTTISRMVDGLEKRNLVVRVQDKVDKRQKFMYLTNLGKERLVSIHKLDEEFFPLLYKGISNKEMDISLKVMNAIVANIENK